MHLDEFQATIADTYGERDRARGQAATVAWLCEELGELARAVRKGTVDQQRHELSDVLAGAAVGTPDELADGRPLASYAVSDFAGLAAAMAERPVQVLDARRDDERASGGVRGSQHVPIHEIAGRMVAAVHDARDAAVGHEAVVVSHQLPIWTTRLFLEKRSYLHHPKTRQCTLCSLTSVVFDDDRVVQVRYSEPAGDLIPVADRSAPFSAGGAPREDRP